MTRLQYGNPLLLRSDSTSCCLTKQELFPLLAFDNTAHVSPGTTTPPKKILCMFLLVRGGRFTCSLGSMHHGRAASRCALLCFSKRP